MGAGGFASSLAAGIGGRNSTEHTISNWMRSDWDKFVGGYSPLLEAQQASINDNSLVGRAESDAGAVTERAAGIQSRALARRGISIGGAQASMMQKAQGLAAATTTANNINNARLEQRDRNEQTAADIANFGADVRNQAMDNMLNGAGIASSRAANNRAAAASNRQQTQAGIATAATIAIML